MFTLKAKNTGEGSLTFQTNIYLHMFGMKRSACSKAVLDDSWITVDTTSLHQHKLYFIAQSLLFVT